MKTILVAFSSIASLLASLATAPGATLFLTAGEIYTYQFNQLPFTGTGVGQPTAQGYFEWHGRLLPGISQVQIEMFENSFAEAPIAAMPIYNSSSHFEPIGNSFIVPNAWQDLQGGIRISVVSGSLSMEELFLASVVPTDSTHANFYDQRLTFEPVPEPSTLTILGCGFVALLCGARRGMKHDT